MPAPLLSVRDLRVRFPHTEPVSGLSFDIAAGETLAVVGESGSGKSLTALAVMGLLPPSARIASGSIALDGRELVGLDERSLSDLRGNKLAMIFQEPMTSLNPIMPIGRQIAEVVRRHRKASADTAWERAVEVLERVRIPQARQRAHDFPHQLSGGQRQRVMIAMAIALEPHLLVADEPTTALDATVQAQVLELLDGLRRDMRMGLLLITHDLGVVDRWSDRTVVMHHGERLEQLATSDLHKPGRHAYTKGLMQASIHLDEGIHYSAASLAEIKVARRADGAWDYVVRPPAAPAAQPATVGVPLLQVRDLSVTYKTRSGPVEALRNVSLELNSGKTLGVVGESGSGKSTLSKAIMRLVPSTGDIRFRGQELSGGSQRDIQGQRRHLQMIFQDPFGSLNPRKSIGQILETPLVVHGVRDRSERRRRIADTLDHVGLPQSATERFPHEFSGGQRQRIGIARALILRPALVICDEPVSALDVSIQAQILNLLVELKRELGLSYLFISHDLAVVQYISDRIIVMKDAQIVEEADHRQLWHAPRTDYTRELIAAATGRGPGRAFAAPRELELETTP